MFCYINTQIGAPKKSKSVEYFSKTQLIILNKSSMKYALISVFDKKNIVSFAKKLHSLGYLIISTGGTSKELINNKIPVVPIEKITGNPESFDGRMKTISFQIESGLLFDRTKKSHVTEASKLQIP